VHRQSDDPAVLGARRRRGAEGKVGQYIFISTISVYAANDAPADETAPLASYTGKDPMAETAETLRASAGELYGPLKAASEREAQKRFPGMTTIIRPGLIAGPGDETDRFTYWPVRLARGGDVLAPGDGTDPVQFIDARDLADWTIRMAEARAVGVFNATGPAAPLTMAEMLRGIAAATKSDAKLTWASTDFLEANKVSLWSDLPAWVPVRSDSAGLARRGIRRALAAGLTFHPLGTAAVDTLAWFRQQPAERQAKLRAGLAPGWGGPRCWRLGRRAGPPRADLDDAEPCRRERQGADAPAGGGEDGVGQGGGHAWHSHFADPANPRAGRLEEDRLDWRRLLQAQ